MRTVKKIIKNNQYLHFFYRVIQNMHNPIFRDRVIGIVEDPALVCIEKKGELYPEGRFYVLDIDDTGNNSGFFAIYNDTLKRLELADRIGATPIIRWTNTAYNNDITSDENMFLYYFQNTCMLDENTLNECKNVIYSKAQDGFPLEEGNLYVQLEDHLDEAARIVKKYLILNETTENEIRSGVDSLFIKPRNTVAVHYRGTDYGAGWKGHPKQLDCFEMMSKTKELMFKNNCEYVFLATDDKRAINAFDDEFGDKLLYYRDVFRGDSNVGIHYQDGQREKHRYLLGLEIIRDVYTMAACKCFIGGKSQVSFAVRAISKAFYGNFSDCLIIDKGINKTGIDSQKINKQFYNNMNKMKSNSELK